MNEAASPQYIPSEKFSSQIALLNHSSLGDQNKPMGLNSNTIFLPFPNRTKKEGSRIDKLFNVSKL